MDKSDPPKAASIGLRKKNFLFVTLINLFVVVEIVVCSSSAIRTDPDTRYSPSPFPRVNLEEVCFILNGPLGLATMPNGIIVVSVILVIAYFSATFLYVGSRETPINKVPYAICNLGGVLAWLLIGRVLLAGFSAMG